jgi:hypothetical protein
MLSRGNQHAQTATENQAVTIFIHDVLSGISGSVVGMTNRNKKRHAGRRAFQWEEKKMEVTKRLTSALWQRKDSWPMRFSDPSKVMLEDCPVLSGMAPK